MRNGRDYHSITAYKSFQPAVGPLADVGLPRRSLTAATFTSNRVFVRSVTNFVIGDEWFCSVFKLKKGD